MYFVRAKYNKVFPREKREGETKRERHRELEREREGVGALEKYRAGGLPGGR